MRGRNLGRVSVALMALAGLVTPAARATSVHQYGKNEYAVIAGGEAPSKAYSIAAHGKGEFGDEDFHLYLMAEPGHKKIGPLEEVTDILDTAPDAYDARWSADSRFVAIAFRIDRHIGTLLLYRIEKGRAFPIEVSTLASLGAGLKLESAEGIEVRARWSELEWIGPSRFRLRETGTIETSLEGARPLATIAKEPPNEAAGPDAPQFVEYELEAEGEIGGRDKLAVELRPAR